MIAIRVALILAAALAAMPLLRGRSAVARRLVLSIAFVAALLVPFAPKRVTAVHVPAYHELVARVVAEPAVTGEATVRVPATHTIDWLTLVWALGALAVGLRAAVGFAIAARLARRARRSSIADVRVSTEVQAPAVAGILAPVILFPASSATWSEERRRSVLLHERAHISAQDLRVQVLVAIVCSLHWFNPLVWLAARRLRLERELAADEAVLRAGLRASSYAEDLLAIAGAAPLGTIAIGEEPLARRISAIVAPHRPARLGRVGIALVVSATSALACGVASTSVSEPAPTALPVAVVAPPASPDLQPVVRRELDQTVATWHAAGGSILVLTPKGEVVAEAGEPDRTVVVGSTMKPLLLATAFDLGVVTEADAFESGPGTTAPVADLLATSNNPGFARIFDKVGSVKLGRVLHDLHFGTPPTIDANTAIGGTMTASPRQVALAYAALARGGDGIISERTAARVTTLMEGVVASESGTGKKARIAGQRIAGKTGTSDWTADATKHTYASFVGYVPADAPRYVIYVGIESATGTHPWGGEVAAPVFARIATQALTR